MTWKMASVKASDSHNIDVPPNLNESHDEAVSMPRGDCEVRSLQRNKVNNLSNANLLEAVGQNLGRDFVNNMETTNDFVGDNETVFRGDGIMPEVGNWEGGEKLSTTRLSLMLSDMQGRLSSSGVSAAHCTAEVVPETEAHQQHLDDHSPIEEVPSSSVSPIEAQTSPTPNTDVKPIRRGGTIRRPSTDQADDSSVSSISTVGSNSALLQRLKRKPSRRSSDPGPAVDRLTSGNNPSNVMVNESSVPHAPASGFIANPRGGPPIKVSCDSRNARIERGTQNRNISSAAIQRRISTVNRKSNGDGSPGQPFVPRIVPADNSSAYAQKVTPRTTAARIQSKRQERYSITSVGSNDSVNSGISGLTSVSGIAVLRNGNRVNKNLSRSSDGSIASSTATLSQAAVRAASKRSTQYPTNGRQIPSNVHSSTDSQITPSPRRNVRDPPSTQNIRSSAVTNVKSRSLSSDGRMVAERNSVSRIAQPVNTVVKGGTVAQTSPRANANVKSRSLSSDGRMVSERNSVSRIAQPVNTVVKGGTVAQTSPCDSGIQSRLQKQGLSKSSHVKKSTNDNPSTRDRSSSLANVGVSSRKTISSVEQPRGDPRRASLERRKATHGDMSAQLATLRASTPKKKDVTSPVQRTIKDPTKRSLCTTTPASADRKKASERKISSANARSTATSRLASTINGVGKVKGAVQRIESKNHNNITSGNKNNGLAKLPASTAHELSTKRSQANVSQGIRTNTSKTHIETMTHQIYPDASVAIIPESAAVVQLMRSRHNSDDASAIGECSPPVASPPKVTRRSLGGESDTSVNSEKNEANRIAILNAAAKAEARKAPIPIYSSAKLEIFDDSRANPMLHTRKARMHNILERTRSASVNSASIQNIMDKRHPLEDKLHELSAMQLDSTKSTTAITSIPNVDKGNDQVMAVREQHENVDVAGSDDENTLRTNSFESEKVTFDAESQQEELIESVILSLSTDNVDKTASLSEIYGGGSEDSGSFVRRTSGYFEQHITQMKSSPLGRKIQSLSDAQFTEPQLLQPSSHAEVSSSVLLTHSGDIDQNCADIDVGVKENSSIADGMITGAVSAPTQVEETIVNSKQVAHSSESRKILSRSTSSFSISAARSADSSTRSAPSTPALKRSSSQYDSFFSRSQESYGAASSKRNSVESATKKMLRKTNSKYELRVDNRTKSNLRSKTSRYEMVTTKSSAGSDESALLPAGAVLVQLPTKEYMLSLQHSTPAAIVRMYENATTNSTKRINGASTTGNAVNDMSVASRHDGKHGHNDDIQHISDKVAQSISVLARLFPADSSSQLNVSSMETAVDSTNATNVRTVSHADVQDILQRLQATVDFDAVHASVKEAHASRTERGSVVVSASSEEYLNNVEGMEDESKLGFPVGSPTSDGTSFNLACNGTDAEPLTSSTVSLLPLSPTDQFVGKASDHVESSHSVTTPTLSPPKPSLTVLQVSGTTAAVSVEVESAVLGDISGHLSARSQNNVHMQMMHRSRSASPTSIGSPVRKSFTGFSSEGVQRDAASIAMQVIQESTAALNIGKRGSMRGAITSIEQANNNLSPASSIHSISSLMSGAARLDNESSKVAVDFSTISQVPENCMSLEEVQEISAALRAVSRSTTPTNLPSAGYSSATGSKPVSRCTTPTAIISGAGGNSSGSATAGTRVGRAESITSRRRNSGSSLNSPSAAFSRKAF